MIVINTDESIKVKGYFLKNNELWMTVISGDNSELDIKCDEKIHMYKEKLYIAKHTRRQYVLCTRPNKENHVHEEFECKKYGCMAIHPLLCKCYK